MYLKPFLFGDAPEMVKMFNFIIDTIQNDHGKEAIIQRFIERFEHAFAITLFELSLIHVLCAL